MVSAVGAVCGLLAGVVATQGVCRALTAAGSEALARTVWQIFSPLLAIAGAVAGALLYRGIFRNRLAPAAGVSAAVLALLAVLCAWLGFSWIEGP